MQVNENYLDELFSHKLGNLEATPPEDGWVRIENELSRRSRMMRRYWLAAASFALVLSVTATVLYLQTNMDVDQIAVNLVPENTSQGLENQPYNIEKDHIDAQQEKNLTVAQYSGNSIKVSATVIPSSTNMQTSSNDDITFSDVHDDPLPFRSDIPMHVDSWNEILRTQPVKENWRKTMSETITQLRLETHEIKTGKTDAMALPTIPRYDEISYNDIINSPTKYRTWNRWEIAGQFAPMHSYRAISSVPDDMRKSDFDDAESPLLAYSGGISFSRELLNRLDIRIGLFYSQMGQTINSVIPVTNMYTTVSSNNMYTKNFVRTSSGSVTVASNLKSDVNTTYANYFNPESQSVNYPGSNIANPPKYRLIERIDYLEIPLVLRYRIIDRKLNFYVLSGMSANILINNNVFVDNNNDIVKGGTILMARPVNYSSALGFGLGYQMNRNLSFVFEPLFKYYLQSYTTSSQIDSNPYAFGVFSSIVYRF